MNKKGFTLIELIIVIAILGILASIIIPPLMDFKGKQNTPVNTQSSEYEKYNGGRLF